ncbi:MAG: UDP-N-acetylmuramoyl-L-alanine--D-glutamate ligase [Anaerolineales bacterium]|nr:UDP-N-acetylmuramoyl-L-alanine--D-glutamate ligase [Anaerolineales bacterium]
MRDWSDLKVVILGAARQGTALARYFVERGARVVLNDQRSADQLQVAQESLADLPVEWVFNGHPMNLLDETDLVCISGGVPLTLPFVLSAQERGIPLSNDSQIFLDETPCKVIGITGSAGKTTTTILVGRMAEAAAKASTSPGKDWQAWVGGNIGSPLIADIDKIEPDDLAVMELSSFQLEIMNSSPQVAAVLNVTPNHLDRHLTMESYTAAKARILANQTASDVAVLGRDDPGAWGLADKMQGQLVSFGLSEPMAGSGTYLRNGDICLRTRESDTWLMSQEMVKLRGEHNLYNVLAACAIAVASDLPIETMRVGVDGFSEIPYRLEFVRSWGGAEWYNDSIATAPERSMAAIRSFDEPLVLLAGGRDKNLPWDEFATLVRQRVDHLILFGEAAEKIASAVGDMAMTRCSNLEEAVFMAAQVVRMGDVVLLSPGGTSFDEFLDFEERGECFKHLVMQL